MPWAITSINNATNALQLTSSDGDVLQISIPDSECTSRDAKNAWIKTQTDAEDTKKKAALPKPDQSTGDPSTAVQKHSTSSALLIVSFIAVLEALALVTILFFQK